MKNYFYVLILISIFSSKNNIVNAQEKKSEKLVNIENIAIGIEFPINTKFTIKVTKVDELNFKYEILKTEPYNKKLDMWNTENLFNENGETETIEFYFAETTNNSNILVMQSRSKYSIKFKSEIKTEENGEFNEIQNVGTHKGSKTTESWAKKTYKIRLSKFELKI
ncbi:hypothetical protein J3S90_08790 [Flavobacterium sp. P4023]|uniref:Uncharacterized protein n=1 Tax=Flavobacterium flabelliforme TaxID=2816119 RepID=A0ABS5CTF3_9FLAO|nr:hypothetical protein [Flavobacterium flabelliforme]MBP4141898.1 hypothetical protein [Flavobacterium flabelliforme]